MLQVWLPLVFVSQTNICKTYDSDNFLNQINFQSFEIAALLPLDFVGEQNRDNGKGETIGKAINWYL